LAKVRKLKALGVDEYKRSQLLPLSELRNVCGVNSNDAREAIGALIDERVLVSHDEYYQEPTGVEGFTKQAKRKVIDLRPPINV